MSMSHPSTEEIGTIARQFTKDLNEAATDGQPNEGIVAVLQRIVKCTIWTKAFSQTDDARALERAIGACSTSPERAGDRTLTDLVEAAFGAYYTRVREDDIRETEARWWYAEPAPEDDASRITLEFRDVTAQHKTWLVEDAWAPETVECTSMETFDRAAQRFRVQANRKYRHPYLPSMHFDALLQSGRLSFELLSSRQITDVCTDLFDVGVVPYVRNDEDNVQESLRSPSRYFKLWERTLPAWCTTPDHWIEPVPPLGFVATHALSPPLEEQYYIKVPTLHVPGNGRNIVPSAKKPDLISRSLYIPAMRTPLGTQLANLEREADYVPHGAHLVPGKVTLDAARALLGRVVQSSTEARADADLPPVGKRRKVNKFAAQRLGLAWGLETSPEGQPLWLHCVELGVLKEYVLSLSGRKEQYGDWRSPLAVLTVPCAWVGAAILPADLEASRRAPEDSQEPHRAPAPPSGASRHLSYDDWYEKTMKWIRTLNSGEFAPVIEVGSDGSFVGGDLGTSKGEYDEFEAKITGAKPGVWLMSVEPGGEDGDDVEGLTGHGRRVIQFAWASDGAVDYDALPRRNEVQASTTHSITEWEVMANFSVDSGLICLFSMHALDSVLSTGRAEDREAMLETFIDEDDSANVFVPSGVVITGDDGGYEIEGRQDANAKVVELRLRI